MLRTITVALVLFGGIADAQVPAQKLTTLQKEVWTAEENAFRYLHAHDLKNYMATWDDRFVGWPDYEQRPVRKSEIEAARKEEVAPPQPPPLPLLLPHPEAVEVFGNVALTHYFWPDTDPAATTKYRTMHTWQKSATGWHIIGGMSCAVPVTHAGLFLPEFRTTSRP